MKILGTTKWLRLCLIAVITVFAFGLATNAQAEVFKQRWSGWFVSSSEADLNGDGTGGEVTFSGRGTFGQSVNHGVTDIVFSGAPCDFDPVTGEPAGLTFSIIQHTNILVAGNGDQLFRVLSSDSESTVCVNFATLTATLVAYLDIVGGTGRFEGATGSTILKTEVIVIGLQNSVTGTEEGEIFGIGRRHDDD